MPPLLAAALGRALAKTLDWNLVLESLAGKPTSRPPAITTTPEFRFAERRNEELGARPLVARFRRPLSWVDMADFLTSERRSEVMSRIRNRDNRSTEVCLIQLFRSVGLHGWQRHLPLPGKPDFTFRTERVCIFAHGCFWHDCRKCGGKSSRTNANYWEPKIAGNRRRDRRAMRALHARGYSVLTIWECSLRSAKKQKATIDRIIRFMLHRRSELGEDYLTWPPTQRN